MLSALIGAPLPGCEDQQDAEHHQNGNAAYAAIQHIHERRRDQQGGA